MTKHQEQIIAAASGKVDEQIVAAAFATPRGATTASVGGGAIVSGIGGKKMGDQRKGAAAGIVLGNPGAVAVTPTSLLTMQVKVTMMGQIKEISEVLSSVPLGEVDSLEVKRMGLAGVMEISVHGSSFKLEGKAGDRQEFAEAFQRTKAGAGAG